MDLRKEGCSGCGKVLGSKGSCEVTGHGGSGWLAVSKGYDFPASASPCLRVTGEKTDGWMEPVNGQGFHCGLISLAQVMKTPHRPRKMGCEKFLDWGTKPFFVTLCWGPSPHVSLFFLFLFLFLFRATPMAYGSSQDRGLIRGIVAGLRHNHSNTGSEPCLQLTPQLSTMPDP